MKINTEALLGDALIWSVALALRESPVITATGVAYKSDHGSWVYPRYTDDTEAVVLMSQEWIGVDPPSGGQVTPLWRAITDSKSKPSPREYKPVVAAFGGTIGLAVCRALVASYFGDVVDVPDELLSARAASA